MSTGRIEFVPNLNPTRIIRVEGNVARNQPGEVVRFFVSGLVGSVSGLSPGKKSSRIRRDLDEIWPNLARSSRNLAESVEIWPRFRQITARSCWIWSENRNTSPER